MIKTLSVLKLILLATVDSEKATFVNGHKRLIKMKNGAF